jgi:D-alanyl-lipoteichoic acid acyltransferase DltB (MBOAT superfamily)
MMPQFAKIKNKVKNYRNIAMGIFIFSLGLFKKVVIADTFAAWATPGFNMAEKLNLFEAWATSLSYTFQLYFDFSGYTDMAIGAALLFNIKLPINFNSPYKATNIQDFWHRWHITLSRFLKDYVYIPLGGNRKGNFKTYNNLMATFLIGGIWHGAGWTFVFWGLLHGIALVIQKIWNQLGLKMNRILAWFITFNFINIAWVFFRANTWSDAIELLRGMFGFHSIIFTKAHEKYLSFLSSYNGIHFGQITEHIGDGEKVMNWLLIGFMLILLFKNSTQKLDNFKLNNLNFFIAFIAFLISILSLNKVSEFLYFNF